MVEGSKFKESHILENTKLWNKVGRMPQPLVLFHPSNSGLALFCACFRYPVLGRSCPYASRHSNQLLKSYKKGELYVGPILFQIEPSYAGPAEVVGISIGKAFRLVYCI
jgi:hypothetical protein